MEPQKYYLKYAHELSTAVADQGQPDVQYRNRHHANNTESDAAFYVVAEQALKGDPLYTSAGEKVPTGDFLIYQSDGVNVSSKKKFFLDSYDAVDNLPDLIETNELGTIPIISPAV